MSDLGLTHIALPVADAEASVAFYSKYARMSVVHRRKEAESGGEVVRVSDRTRPFVVVFIRVERVEHPLVPWPHLGVGCEPRGGGCRTRD